MSYWRFYNNAKDFLEKQIEKNPTPELVNAYATLIAKVSETDICLLRSERAEIRNRKRAPIDLDFLDDLLNK